MALKKINNFIVEADEQLYEKMRETTRQFLLGFTHKEVTSLKDNFDHFYSKQNTNSQVENDMNKYMEYTTRCIFNELYIYYYNKYGKGDEGISRGIIKHKLQELVTIEVIRAIVYTG